MVEAPIEGSVASENLAQLRLNGMFDMAINDLPFDVAATLT